MRVQAVITYHDARGSTLVVQEGDAAIFVSYPDSGIPPMRGQKVEIEGSTTHFGPLVYIGNASFKLLGKSDMPRPLPATFAQLAAPANDGRFIETEGIIKAVGREYNRTVLTLEAGKSQVHLCLRDEPLTKEELMQLVNARVRARGVASLRIDAKGLIERGVLMQDLNDLTVLEKSDPGPFEGQPTSAKSLNSSEPALKGRRLKIEGKVIRLFGVGYFVLKDDTGEIRVQTTQEAPMRAGDHAVVVGFAGEYENEPALVQAIFRLMAPAGKRKGAAAAELLPLLQQAKEIRDLSPTEAARGFPVRLRAIVTYTDPRWGLYFVHDGRFGIFVMPGAGNESLRSGQLVEIEGYSAAGDFAPDVIPVRITRQAQAEFPTPLQPSLGQLNAGKLDSQWVAMQGVVRAVEATEAHLILTIATDDGSCQSFIPIDFARGFHADLVDAEIRVRGAVVSLFNSRGQVLGSRLYTPSPAEVTVIRPAIPDPFALETVTVASLGRFNPHGSAAHRVKIAGKVTCPPEEDDSRGFVSASAAGYRRRDPPGRISRRTSAA